MQDQLEVAERDDRSERAVENLHFLTCSQPFRIHTIQCRNVFPRNPMLVAILRS